MRILRGKSNLEVSYQGFAWFVVGLVLASFFGGAIRVLLSSQTLNQKILAELKKRFPDQHYQIEKTEILLSNGYWPGLAISLSGVRFAQEKCGKLSFTLNLPQLVFPVDLWSLKENQWKLGQVRSDGGSMHLRYHPCPAKPGSDPSSEDLSQALSQSLSQPNPPEIDLRWQTLRKYLQGIELTNFFVTYERNNTWKLVVPYLQLSLGRELVASGYIDVQKSLPFGALSQRVDFSGRADDRVLNWNIQSNYKEGLFNWQGSIDLLTKATLVEVGLSQIPVKDLLSELRQTGFISSEISLRNSWLSCDAKWEGQLSEAKIKPVTFRSCKIEGSYGRVEIKEGEWLALNFQNPFPRPASFEIKNLQLQALVEGQQQKSLSRIFSRLGVLSGVLSLSHYESGVFNGQWESLEILFSNQSVRGKQTVRQMDVRLEFDKLNHDFAATEIDLQDGNFTGSFAIKSQERGRVGQFKIDSSNFLLSPAIQKLLFSGQMSSMQIKGEGQWNAKQIQKWQGEIKSEQMVGEGWKISQLVVRSKVSSQQLLLEALAKSIEVDNTWKHYPLLEEISSERNNKESNRDTWQDPKAQISLTREGGKLESFVAKLNNALPFTAKASWIRDGELTGAISLKQRQYLIRGEKGQFFIQSNLLRQ